MSVGGRRHRQVTAVGVIILLNAAWLVAGASINVTEDTSLAMYMEGGSLAGITGTLTSTMIAPLAEEVSSSGDTTVPEDGVSTRTYAVKEDGVSTRTYAAKEDEISTRTYAEKEDGILSLGDTTVKEDGVSTRTYAAKEDAKDVETLVVPLEVADLNKDPYRNTTYQTVLATRAADVDDHVTQVAGDDVTTGGSERPSFSSSVETFTLVAMTTSPPPLVLAVEHGDHGHLNNGRSPAFSQPTEAAAVMAGVLITAAVVGYVGLVAWRKILERRYSSREMLVEEDDDLHHFEL